MNIHGFCDPKFAPVREAFIENFNSRGDVGAAVAVTVDNARVVDLWGGHKDVEKTEPWLEDTIVNVFSTTKGMTAICAHRLIQRGELDLDAPVVRYWPEFGAAGKADVPVRQLLCHQVGLAAIDKPLTAEDIWDWKTMTTALAEQEPNWEPGTKHGYHALTFGWLVGELVRRVSGKSLGTFFRDEVAEPLGLDFHIGTGAELDHRVAPLLTPEAASGSVLSRLGGVDKDSLLVRVFTNPPIGSANELGWRRAEIPAGNGHGTARSLARVYGALANGGSVDGFEVLSPEAIATATTEQSYGPDAVLIMPTRYGLGFWLSSEQIPLSPSTSAFGHPGMGGSVGFADPDSGVGFGYVMNQMSMGVTVAGTGSSLISALYSCLE